MKLKNFVMKVFFTGSLVFAAVSAQAGGPFQGTFLEKDLGKAIGLKSKGDISRVFEGIGYVKGNPALVAGSIAADRTWGRLKKHVPAVQKWETRVTNRFNRQVRKSFYQSSYDRNRTQSRGSYHSRAYQSHRSMYPRTYRTAHPRYYRYRY